MKKTVITSIIQMIALLVFLFVGVHLVRELKAIRSELTQLKEQQAKVLREDAFGRNPFIDPFDSKVLKVEVVNEPTVAIGDIVDVNIVR